MKAHHGRPLLALALVAAAASAQAQTNDAVFRSYQWNQDVSAPRAAGLAGAFVGLADDSSALLSNPAGIATLPKTELAGGLLARRAGTTGQGDSLAARTGVGYIGGAGNITPHWAIGAYLIEPQDERLTLPTAPYVGRLDITQRDAGVAGAWHPTEHVYIGLRLTDSHLRLQSLYSHESGASTDLQVGMGAGQDKVTGDAGLLFVSGNLRLGAAYRQGVSWDVSRTAQDPLHQVVLDAGSNKLVRSPSAFSGGLSYRINTHLLMTGQVDYVLYSQIRGDLGVREGAFVAADYTLADAAEARAGAEVAWPIGSMSLIVRGGVYSQAPNALAYAGADSAERLLFPARSRQTLTSAGATIWSRTVQVHGAVTFGGDRSVVVAGATVRF
jgi:long-subunit fatty acid transport protein